MPSADMLNYTTTTITTATTAQTELRGIATALGVDPFALCSLGTGEHEVKAGFVLAMVPAYSLRRTPWDL